MAEFCAELGVSSADVKALDRAPVLIWGSVSASKLTLVGRTQLLMVVGLSTPVLAGSQQGCSQLLEVTPLPCHMAPPSLTPGMETLLPC